MLLDLLVHHRARHRLQDVEGLHVPRRLVVHPAGDRQRHPLDPDGSRESVAPDLVGVSEEVEPLSILSCQCKDGALVEDDPGGSVLVSSVDPDWLLAGLVASPLPAEPTLSAGVAVVSRLGPA